MTTFKILLLSSAVAAFAFGAGPVSAQGQPPQELPQGQQGGGGSQPQVKPDSAPTQQPSSPQAQEKPDQPKPQGQTTQQKPQGQTEKKAQDQTKPQGQTTTKKQDQTKPQGQTTTQQQGTTTTGSAKLEEKQVTTIKQYFTTNKVTVKAVPRNSISVSIGVAVPRHVRLYPLPSVIVIDAPARCSYHYFLWGDDIVIVDSCTRLVVAIIVDVV